MNFWIRILLKKYKKMISIASPYFDSDSILQNFNKYFQVKKSTGLSNLYINLQTVQISSNYRFSSSLSLSSRILAYMCFSFLKLILF